MPIDLRLAPFVPTLLAWLLVTLPLPALAQVEQPVGPHLMPPSSSPPLMKPDWAVSCDGEGLARQDGQDLPPFAYGEAFGPQTGQRIVRTRLDFTIDAQGRTRDIRPTPGGSDADGPLAGFSGPAGDLVQATLAGWSFAPAARSGCSLSVRYTPVPVDRADTGLLLKAFAVTRVSSSLRRAVQQRLSGSSLPCDAGSRARRRGYPDFQDGPRRPGQQDWTVVRWNIDREGRFIDVETLGSSGDAAFDAQARDGATRSQATPGPALTGCVYNWFRQGGKLAAPPVPEPPSDLASHCPAAVLSTFKVRTPGQTPAAFSARGIEGWALVRFDIAPWGDVGNVAVIEAQPAAAFGTAAQDLVMSGRADAGPGATRCVQPVFFRSRDPD